MPKKRAAARVAIFLAVQHFTSHPRQGAQKSRSASAQEGSPCSAMGDDAVPSAG